MWKRPTYFLVVLGLLQHAICLEPFSVQFQVLIDKHGADCFIVDVYPQWAPIGAQRFHDLIQDSYFDDTKFFRVVEHFVAQFGIANNVYAIEKWNHHTIRDDPVRKSNTRGYLAFAKPEAGNSRTTQMFINMRDNSRLDSQGFAPFGKVRSEGMMKIVDMFGIYEANQDKIMNVGYDWTPDFLTQLVSVAIIPPKQPICTPPADPNKVAINSDSDLNVWENIKSESQDTDISDTDDFAIFDQFFRKSKKDPYNMMTPEEYKKHKALLLLNTPWPPSYPRFPPRPPAPPTSPSPPPYVAPPPPSDTRTAEIAWTRTHAGKAFFVLVGLVSLIGVFTCMVVKVLQRNIEADRQRELVNTLEMEGTSAMDSDDENDDEEKHLRG